LRRCGVALGRYAATRQDPDDRTLMQVKAPFSAVEKQISEAANLARDAGFSSELEAAVNAQINVELTLRHVTQALP